METTNTASVLEVEVSSYLSYKQPTPTTISLLSFLTSLQHKEKVDKIRSIEDKKRRDELKALLPAITPSGVFTYREAKGLMKHSGLMQFDIDFKDNQHIGNYNCIKEQLKFIKNVAYVGRSVSGTGYWGLIPIAYTEMHREHFLALEKVFKKIGINIDASCKDVCRLRGYSYDPNAYFNHEAKFFFETAQTTRSTYSAASKKRLWTNDATAVESCLTQIESQEVDITGSYQVWFSIGCALANTFKEDGLDYFQRVSQYHPSYDEADTEDKYEECLKGYSYSLGTFFHYCSLLGIYPISKGI